MPPAITNKIQAFFEPYKQQHFQKGYILAYAEHEPPGIFLLEAGQVRQYDISDQGDEIVVNVFKPGAFFPMSWAINQTPNQYFYDATDKITVRQAPAEAVVEFLKANPDVTFNLLSRVYSGLDGLLRRMAHLMGGTARTKLLYELLISARRFGKLQAGGSYLVEISEGDLAKRCGLSRETVSRELGKLKPGLIKVSRQGFTILNLSDLEKELGANL